MNDYDYGYDELEYEAVVELERRLKERSIDMIDFLERMPDRFVPFKEDMIAAIKEKRNERVISCS